MKGHYYRARRNSSNPSIKKILQRLL